MILRDGFVHRNVLSDKVGVFDGLQDVILNQKVETRNGKRRKEGEKRRAEARPLQRPVAGMEADGWGQIRPGESFVSVAPLVDGEPESRRSGDRRLRSDRGFEIAHGERPTPRTCV